MSTWAAERTIELLAADDGRPCFCLMSLFDPHDPYDDHPAASRQLIDPARIPAPLPGRAGPATTARERSGSYLGRFEDFSAADLREIRHGYAASVAFADRQIGRVLDALDASGRAANTLVVFLSDHGDQLGDHGLMVKGAPLYEPTVGIPLILRWPERLAAGSRCKALAQGRDVAATCLAAAGLDTATCPDAEDLVAVARAGATRRGAAICAYRNSGIGDAGAPWDPPMLTTMARDSRHKLVISASGDTIERELFDLEADPGEQIDLAGRTEHAGVERALTDAIVGFLLAEAAAAPPRAAPATPGTRSTHPEPYPLSRSSTDRPSPWERPEKAGLESGWNPAGIRLATFLPAASASRPVELSFPRGRKWQVGSDQSAGRAPPDFRLAGRSAQSGL